MHKIVHNGIQPGLAFPLNVVAAALPVCELCVGRDYTTMRTYTLTTPKDANGQPLRMFKANLENNVSKAIDQLSGICSGILADCVVTEQEATFFAEWVRKFAPFEPVCAVEGAGLKPRRSRRIR